MPRQQLSLISIQNPLRSDAWNSFFETIPSGPGAYQFWDVSGQCIYVGKAKSLRKRLFSYRKESFQLLPKKTQRLILKTASISIKQTMNETDAFLLEDEWIKEYRPHFNRVNNEFEAYYFFILHFNSTNDLLSFE